MLAVLRGTAEIKSLVRFTEKDGVIYFTVTSNGMTGKEWIIHFNSKGAKINDYAKQLLLSEDFKPRKKGSVHQIEVIKGEFFSNENRTTSNIRQEADKRKLSKPNAEVACLIRDLFTGKEIRKMGLCWIVTIHEPIKDSHGYLSLLSVCSDGDVPCLRAFYGVPGCRWDREDGFAFVSSQVE